MIDFDNMKSKIKDSIDEVIVKGSEVTENASNKAKELSTKTKLKSEIFKANNELKKLMGDLGSLYYCLNKDHPQDELAQICADITKLKDRINEAENMIISIDTGKEISISSDNSD